VAKSANAPDLDAEIIAFKVSLFISRNCADPVVHLGIGCAGADKVIAARGFRKSERAGWSAFRTHLNFGPISSPLTWHFSAARWIAVSSIFMSIGLTKCSKKPAELL
jgi:hypothetical protein